MKTNNKGFSLVELIVVIAIMAILAAVAIPTFSGFITKAQVSGDVSFINDVTYAAKVSNSAEHVNQAVTVSVTVDENGAITSVSYTVENGETDIVVTMTEGAASTQTGGEAADVSIGNEVRDCIDWDYQFKSTKAAGTYKLGADGKSLAS